jgi:phosphatidylserine decarboxylase
MDWGLLLSSLVLSLVILLPLSLKWKIPSRISVPSSVTIGILVGLLVNIAVGIRHVNAFNLLILQLFLILGIFASFLVLRFYRNPERISPEDVDAILSPADGKVIYIKRYEAGIVPYSEKNGKRFLLNEFIQSDVLSKAGYVIGISQNFLDVHVNRAPISGHVSIIRYIKGAFISLKKQDAVIRNERALTVIENSHIRVGIVQIASRLVRNILIYFREGQEIRRGERLGVIRFGSQVDLILPSLPPINIEIKPGYYVKAGVSIVARITGDSQSR